MHKSLTIENFKCFSEATHINLSSITVCLGSNSVGKSSVIQCLILLRQLFEKTKIQEEPINRSISIQLNDFYGLQLGDAEHIKSSKKVDDVIIQVDDYAFVFSSKAESPLEMEVKLSKELPQNEGLFSEGFYYLNAERLGPRNYQIIDSKMINGCGVYGENTIHYLNKNGRNKVDEKRCFGLDDSKKINSVVKQVEYWMDYIVPGISLKVDEITELRLSKVQFQQTLLDTGFLSPYSFGFGISYVLPIIVTGLTAKKGSVFLVENPEAHLHPMGQSHIGLFLAQMAFSGIQIIVETHSEHVINGIRIAALKGKESPEAISINYFSVINDGDVSHHVVENIRMNERMDIQSWPTGFMDQEEDDLRTIRLLRRKE